jgi:hypothetical protein
MKRSPRWLTYSNVISTLCLVLLLGGGTAYAASHLGKGSVGSNQLKKGAVTPAKLSKASKSALTGSRGATGPQGPQGAKGEPGEKGTPGDPGAYATVSQAAPAEFLGTHPGFVATERLKEGVYCLTPSPGVSTMHAIASLEWNTSINSNLLVEPIGSGQQISEGCAAGKLEIRTFELLDGGFVVQTNKASFSVFLPAS